MNIHDIKNDDLVYFGERIEPYFASSIIIRGMVEPNNVHTVLGWEDGVRWLYTNNYFFILKSDLAKVKSEILQNIKVEGPDYAAKLVAKCFEFGNHLIDISKEIETKASENKLHKSEMRDLLAKYLEAASHYMIFQNIALFEDAVSELAHGLIKKYAKDSESEQKLLDLITTTNRLTGGEKENDDFLRLCLKDEIGRSAAFADHAKEHGWLSLRFFVGQPWTTDNVALRAKSVNRTMAEQELTIRLENRQIKERQIAEATKDLTPEDQGLVRLIRDMVFLRTQRTDFFQQSSYFVFGLVNRIAEAFGVTYDELLYLSVPEVFQALDGRIDVHDIVNLRKQGFLVFFDYDQDRILEGEEVASYIKERPIMDRDSVQTDSLAGKVGYAGRASGRVKIVKTDQDNSKVEKGDIIVAIMTTPNFIPAMEKASAFITDEGGITCHAAIIARELKKPCIIGTKNATKVLKDGDEVEVDADKGIVRILKRAS